MRGFFFKVGVLAASVAGADLRLKGNTPKASEPDRKQTPRISLRIHSIRFPPENHFLAQGGAALAAAAGADAGAAVAAGATLPDTDLKPRTSLLAPY